MRQQTISLVESATPDILDIVPLGFSNSIRWNLGHILVAWDYGIFPKINESTRMPSNYYRLFPKGTRPSNWSEAPPSVDEITNYLKSQVDDIIEACEGKMNDLIAEPFLRVKYLRGMFSFHNREELYHLDCMRRIKAAIETTPYVNRH
nr:DinB family protein [Paenibacillus alba]